MKCAYCFEELTTQGACFCPRCGYQNGVATDPLYLQPHSIIGNGRYEIGCVVGAGGFGITYSAFDLTLSTRVAIKEYLPGEFSTRVSGAIKVTVYGGEKQEQFEDGLMKFYEESNRLAQFNEVPGIVQIYDVFQENDTAYIVMEFLEGEDLGQRLKREGRISPEEAVRIMQPVLDALTVVHSAGIIHRDIAPNNIYLCRDGRVKLLDFGAARYAIGVHSKSLTVLFKEGYTPEEQYQSRGDQGPWTDVYASAATMYKAITGFVPESAMERRRKDTLKEPSKCGVKLETNVERAIMNALVLDPKKRTRSASQFRDELLGTGNVSKRFKRATERKQARIPKPVLIASGVLLSLVLVLFLLLRFGVLGFGVNGIFNNDELEEGTVRVANVINMETTEAEERLKEQELGFEIIDYKYSNRVIEGRVISQKEEKGEIVTIGTVVHVTVSQGAGFVDVPSLVGKQWEEMQLVMEDLCLEYELTEVESTEAPGVILSQNVEAGTTLEQGQTVAMEVSKGMNYDAKVTSEAPSFLGSDIEEAKAKAASLNAYIKVIGYENSDTYKKNTICSQNVEAGSTIHGNDVIEVIVSLGLESVSVPYVLDMDREDAEALLKQYGLKAEFEEVVSIDIEGQVLGQSIVADQIVTKGTTITLRVAVKELKQEEPPVEEVVEEESEQVIEEEILPEDEEEEDIELEEFLTEEQQEQVAEVVETVDETNTDSGNVSIKESKKYKKVAKYLVDDGYAEDYETFIEYQITSDYFAGEGLDTDNFMAIVFAKKGHRYYYERGGNNPKSGSSKKKDNKKWTEEEISEQISILSDGEGYTKMGMAYAENGDAVVVLGR